MEIKRRYYLSNLNQTVELSYAVCEACQFIFQGEYVGDEFCAFARVQYDGWRTAINALLDGEFAGKRIALYPASHLTFEALTESNLSRANLLGMYDIDAKKQGQKILGLEVYAPDELKRVNPDVIFVFTMGYEREIRESFDAMGLSARVISITELVNNSWN